MLNGYSVIIKVDILADDDTCNFLKAGKESEQMTNAEKIIAILKPRKDQIRIHDNWVEIEIQKLGINFSCELDWWNAEYEEPKDTKTITISKGAVKHGNKDYVVYKRDWLMEHLDSEFEVLKGARELGKKIQNAKPSTWLTDGLTEEEVKQIIDDAKEQAKRDCEHCKHYKHATDFKTYMDSSGCESWECKFEPKEVMK